MGGSYKKKQRAEKAKVKLKGAKLPKGLNVTKTEFKIRKIIIKEQLKDIKYVDGQRQINIKETLNRLKHHGSNFRLESLRKLREAIVNDSLGILGCLNEIIQGVVSMCLDAERDIRRESFKTLSSLLDSLKEVSIAPFFHIISSYLRCAMTHIQPHIQEDSLLMLDVLLDHIPSLVAKHSHKIFQNFLEMISRVRADGDKAGRMLTVNMGKKQTNIKWRSKVLLRLQQMLSNLVIQREEEKSSRGPLTIRGGKQKNALIFNAKVPQYYGVNRSYQNNLPCDLSNIFQRTIGENAMPGNVFINEECNQLKSYVDHLMPLLLESWLEVRPQHSSGQGIEHLINSDAAQALKIVLEIIADLWFLIDIHEEQTNNHAVSLWFQDQYKEIFALHFLQIGYPYELIDGDKEVNGPENSVNKKRSRKSNLSLLTSYCYNQNISASYIMCRFFAGNVQTQVEKFSCILKYLKGVVDSMDPKREHDYLSILLKALKSLLFTNGLQMLQNNHEGTLLLLKSYVKSFLSHKFGDSVSSSTLLLLLCEIVQSSCLYKAYNCQELKEFLKFLPHLLLKSSISESTLLSMVQLGKQQNEVFLSTLRQLLSDVVKNLERIKVNGALDVIEGKKLIINLFYWLNTQSVKEEVLREITNNLNEYITDKRLNDYCHYVLTLNFNKGI
uniref:Pre-rRNA-processing protein Ipi1 N-terminal domain-containing protein n=1 Tax=Glossina morsitans morsitans TaxID=37546 RepID=A0A1B0FCU1_GLOMM